MEAAMLEQLAQAVVLQLAKGMLNQNGGDISSLLKTPAQFDTSTPLHGWGGIFSTPGTERDVITAHIRPRGILSVLPRIPSNSEDPTFATLTGYTAPTGSEPDNACDDAPAGYVKGCNLTARFGLHRRDTQTIEMDQVMRKLHRGDFTDLVLRGKVLGLQGIEPSGLNQAQILNIVTMSEMVTVARNIENVLNMGVWQSTFGGNWGYPGLASQVATGQVDADSNQACPALDSDVKDFNYQDVCGNVLDIVEYLSMMEYYLTWNAESMGLDPVDFRLSMRPQLFWELSSCWPCRYMTNRCTDFSNPTNQVLIVNDSANVEFRDRMRRESAIPINGTWYPVIKDTGIYEANNVNNGNLEAGQFASSIFFLPFTITDGFPVLYLEYVDYRLAQVDVNLLRGTESFWWTDAGFYSWASEFIKWCYKLSLKVEPRVVLRTPQLAGRIDNVRYTPLQHLREPDPDSPYNEDGGVSLRSPGTRHAVWM